MKYKYKRIKITYYESIFVGVVFLFLTLFILLYPKNTGKSFLESKFENKTVDDFVFAGQKVDEVTFDNRYYNGIYKNNDNIESHLIDLKKGKEVNIKDFINEEYLNEFNNVEKDLLDLKYPKNVSEKLVKSKDKKYWFKDNELTIMYENKDILPEKDYNLTINYNYISTFLNFTVSLDNTYEKEDAYNLYDNSKMTVAFSFDDGPNKEKTTKLIDCLEDYKMSATFFMVGYKLEGSSDVVKYVASSHSEIGYHSWNHQYLTKQSANTIKDEFNYSDNILYSITGLHFKLTRPPYGSFNQNVLSTLDTPLIRWNLDTNDWRYKDATYITNYVLENIEDGAIILFHDSYDTSVEAACFLMKTLYEKDIQVVNVSKLAEMKNVSLNPHEVYFSFK